jgi:hypothetical protein
MVCEPWIGAKEWLNAQVRQKISMERRELAEAATVLLATLPWDSMPVHTLWCYLGPHWTTGTQQNDLLDILSDHITTQPALAEQLQVKGLALSTKIIEAAATQNATAVRGPPISAQLRVQLRSISAQLRSEHATPNSMRNSNYV